MVRALPLFLAMAWLVGCTGVGRLPVADQKAEPAEEPDIEGDLDLDAPLETVDTPLPPDDVPGPACTYEAGGALKYVSIDLSGNKCVYTLAEAKAGITFNYRIVVEKAVHNVVSFALDAGHCDEPGTSGLRVFEKIHGAGHSWCICDEGLCGPGGAPIEIPEGVYEDSFTWDGVNWNGPSDTGNPKGAPFPPGDYTLVLRVEGTYGQGELLFDETATMLITLVE